MEKLIIEDFFNGPCEWTNPPYADCLSYYFKASGKIFSLNESFVLKEIEKLPAMVKRIPIRDCEHKTDEFPTIDFFSEIADVKTEFGDDITVFLKNGCIFSSYLYYLPQSELSIPILNFWTVDDIKKFDVSDDPKMMYDVKIEMKNG